MARPRLNDELSPANIVARMVPGRTYGASNIATRLRVQTVAVRPLLEQMVKEEMLEISRERPAMIGFRRPEPPAVDPEPDEPTLSVAGRPELVRLDGTLTDYDSEIARRVALCLSTRKR
jgi:hypothetical protein